MSGLGFYLRRRDKGLKIGRSHFKMQTKKIKFTKYVWASPYIRIVLSPPD